MATARDLSEIIAPITITFKQLVASLISIGQKGTVLYAVKDAALAGNYSVATYESAFNLDIADAAIKANVQEMFKKGGKKVILFKFKSDLASVSDQLDKLTFNWIVSDDADSQTAVSDYAKEKDVFGLVYKVAADHINVVNCPNPSAVRNGQSISMLSYLPILAGALAGVPYNKSATSLTFDDIDSVDMPEEIHKGELVLYNESDGVRIAAAVNSLVNLGTDQTPDMQEICIVEGMKRFKTDVLSGFKTSYKGQYKNNYDNQSLLFSAFRGYIKDLEDLEILDKNYDNTVDVNIDKQRKMWIAAGKTEAETWTDAQVRRNTYKNMIYPKFNVRFLDAIDGMDIEVDMF